MRGKKRKKAVARRSAAGVFKDQDVAQLEDFSVKEEQEEAVFQKRKVRFCFSKTKSS